MRPQQLPFRPKWKSSLASTAAAAVTVAIPQEPFPSIVIRGGGNHQKDGNNNNLETTTTTATTSFPLYNKSTIQPQGSFAVAQAKFLDPDPEAVETLKDGLLQTNIGIVAHYYMDVELQGVLQALKQSHPLLEQRIGIADSLKMGDLAVQMCQQQQSQQPQKHHDDSNNHLPPPPPPAVQGIICLGVDFMSESVQAILNKNGFGHVPVYRAKPQAIGCSLAESAEKDTYRAWLQYESQKAIQDHCVPLHVIYINTSLETKAVSSALVPTITCTSSNVLQTLLQASYQIGKYKPLRILYGPDTYMGENLIRWLDIVLENQQLWTDEKIATDLHPHHTRMTLQTLRENVKVYPQGNCVVHHMFGASVVERVKQDYLDNSYMTAHLEVPGEMFDLAMTKSLQDEGVVGSTSDILQFITRKVQEAATSATTTNPSKSSGDTTTSTTTTNPPQRLRFVLGTEAGMVTSIVKNVQEILGRTNNHNTKNHHHNYTHNVVEAEIIFPVSSEAVMATTAEEEEQQNDDGNSISLPIVPGVSGGDGCSTAGGCATCPFMKMNDLDAVQDIIEMILSKKNKKNNNNNKNWLKLQKHLPPNRLVGKSIQGVDATTLGTESIMYMRHFMQTKTLPEELVQKVKTFGSSSKNSP